jgi:hypothetical protein
MYRALVLLIFVLTQVSNLPAYPPAQPAQAPAVQEEPRPPLSVPPEYRYNRRGRRDPFINPVPVPVARGPVIPAIRPPGLRGVLVSEAGISGVVTSKEPSMNVVILSAPGAKTYFARVGDQLFDAVIKEIKLDTVTFALTAPGGDQSNPREIVRQVRPTGDAK